MAGFYEDKELTVEQVAKCFAPHLSVNAIRRIIRLGNIGTRKEGRTRYVNIGDIEWYLDEYGYGEYYPKCEPGEPPGEWMALLGLKEGG